MDVWSWVIDFRQRNDPFGTAKRVSSVSIFQFYHSADIAGGKRRYARARFSIELVNLPNFLGAAAISVVEFAAEFYRAGVDAEERELAELRFAHRFEDVEDRVRSVQADLDGVAVGVHRLDLRGVCRGRAVLCDDVHHSR